MKILSQMHVVQFSFWEYNSFHLRVGGTGFLGPNGAGKTSMVDGVQIALLGGNTKQMRFNSQLSLKDHRTIRDYALGTMRSENSDKTVLTRKREEAISYITLVFEGDKPDQVVSAGICLHSTAKEKEHSVLGLYVLPGVRLTLEDHLGAIENSEKAPLDWPMFESQVRQMAKAVGRLPTIAPTSKAYQHELLHCLQHKGRTIQPEKYARALAQSFGLKKIESVNDYLRGYLVDAEAIDRSGTLSHIKHVRQLKEKIAMVTDDIIQLGSLDKRFQNLNANYQSAKAAESVLLQLKVETLDEDIANLMHKEELASKELVDARAAQMQKEGEAKTLLETVQNLIGAYNADPEAKRPEEARALRSARAIAATERKRVIEGLSVQIQQALDMAAVLLELAGKVESPRAKSLSHAWETAHEKENFATRDMCEEAISFLSEIEPIIASILEEAIERASFASAALKAAAQRVEAAKNGVKLKKGEDRIPTVMALFADQGIRSTTVASLVRVVDEKWQAVIESFLGGNRFALVVDPGRERDAVRIMRTTGKDIYNITVVQPEHLQNWIGRPTEPHSVASLIGGDHKVAVAFLRRCIGKVRQVDSEEDLEQFDHSLTRDGMLSLNGGTRRIRLINEREQWELGVTSSTIDIEDVANELRTQIKNEKEARTFQNTCREVDELIRRVKNECKPTQYSAALTAYQASKSELDASVLITSDKLPQHLVELKSRIETTTKQVEAANKAQVNLGEKVGSIEVSLKNFAASIELNKTSFKESQSALDQVRRNEFFADNIAIEYYVTASDVQRHDGEANSWKWLQEKIDAAQKYITKWEAVIRAEFREFINARSINLVEEHSEWKKAWAWTRRHNEKLLKSTLVEYESQAEEAKNAADKAFRSDVAFKIRDAIKRVQRDIQELNKILGSCPEFTGGERYKFRAEPSSAYEGLYTLIEGSAHLDSSTMPLESASEATQSQLLKLLDACETGSLKGANPLEDYRLLFNFDLDIYVNDVRVDSLSKRLGVGSNGEHLVPFYVIAGASLANAYGMKAGAQHDGAAIMLIDEAFHGFDAQNTYVTGRFLRSLGLQLIVAAPDADIGKLSPILDSVYDLNRFGADVFPDEHVIKDQTQEMFRSDIPAQNPQLVADRIAQLSLIQ